MIIMAYSSKKFDKLKDDFISKEIIRTRCEKNQKVLDDIFEEILEICHSLKYTKDRHSRAILESRYRILTNKYCYSNSLDETISFNRA